MANFQFHIISSQFCLNLLVEHYLRSVNFNALNVFPCNSTSDFHFSRAACVGWSWKESDIPVFKDSHGIPLDSQPAKVFFLFFGSSFEREMVGWSRNGCPVEIKQLPS